MDENEVEPLRDVVHHNDEATSEDESGDPHLREVGMVNAHHSLQLDLVPNCEARIQETSENAAIIENVREYAKVIQNKYLPSVKAWLAVLAKYPGTKEELNDVIELKGEIDDALFKYGRMAFTSADDVSTDSELEEVPDLSDPKPKTTSSNSCGSTEWSIFFDNRPMNPEKQDMEEDTRADPEPSTSGGETSDRKKKLLAVAPKLPYDVDLYHWEDEKLPVPTLVPSSTDGHRFWVGSEGTIDELPVPEGSAALRTRVIEFTGKFKPVTHSCRVRLPSGRLCPRQDRYKCPFHGEIVPRDEKGNCINPKDAVRIQELREKKQQEKPDWQNPKLLADIKRATGIDLKMPEKGKRKKKKLTGLTDLKETENSAKKRLENKIFKKSVMKKVAVAMDKMDRRKFRDKFGDQFHYFYDK
ncbi:UV-stimulated scaffold protein A-like isoform X2 [Macrosteles quadrilineatus]|nr:UV-stimulated scaffold protein A-like isoform X2 [Macrosteles quadrilineatus]